MNHLLVCREYARAAYPPGSIGTYVRHMAGLLAETGEVVHVIAQRWEGASAKVTQSLGGKLVIHRVALEDGGDRRVRGGEFAIPRALARSDCPAEAATWSEKARWIVRTLVQPRRTARWIAWQFRTVAARGR